MKWPQIVILVIIILGFTLSVLKTARTEKSAGMTIFLILFAAAWSVGYALVLSARGFW